MTVCGRARENAARAQKRDEQARATLARLLGGYADPHLRMSSVRAMVLHLQWLDGKMPTERYKLDAVKRNAPELLISRMKVRRGRPCPARRGGRRKTATT